jgi:hypothetical protein
VDASILDGLKREGFFVSLDKKYSAEAATIELAHAWPALTSDSHRVKVTPYPAIHLPIQVTQSDLACRPNSAVEKNRFGR